MGKKQDELEAELEELEEEEEEEGEIEDELPEPPARRSVEPSAKAAASSRQGSDVSELTRLQAEMAL